MAEGTEGVIRIEVPDLDSILDREDAGDYPHRGLNLADGVGEYIEMLARDEMGRKTLTVEVAAATGPSKSTSEEEVRDAIHRYFTSELQRAGVDYRVNQTEGWHVFGWAFGLSLAFIVGAVVLVLVFPTLPDYRALSYLIAGFVIIVVWVLIWDPFEKITFTARLMIYRNRALEKLRASTVRFTYGSSGTTMSHWNRPGS